MELIRSLLLHRLRPSPDYSRVGSCIISFVACSAFTHVTTYRLAKSPYATLYTGGSGGFVASTAAPIATGWSDPAPGAGLHPAVDQRFSRRAVDRLVTAARQRDDRMITETANQGRRFRVPTSRKIRGESSGPRPHQVPAMPIVRRTPFRPTILSSLWSLILTR